MERGALDSGGEDALELQGEAGVVAGASNNQPNRKRKISIDRAPIKQSVNPFEASPVSSPSPLASGDELQPSANTPAGVAVPRGSARKGAKRKAVSPGNSDDEGTPLPVSGNPSGPKVKEAEEEEEDNLDFELGKSQTVNPEKMQAILSKFSPEQMSRYECYRRSGFQKSNMRRLLQGVAGCTVSIPMTIVMSGIAKMFVGELVETGRIVMTERKESGPIRPCHIREAYRRLKVKGKVPQRNRPRLFH